MNVFTVCFVFGAKCQELNGHDYVDLALPSGTLWATCNVGANHPAEWGEFYAWGETKSKAKGSYTWLNYSLNKGKALGNSERPALVTPKIAPEKLLKYCFISRHGVVDKINELALVDDAASANWGKDWRMPSVEQIEELLTYCNFEYSWQGNAYCSIIRGRNGNSIVVPLSGNYVVIPGEKTSRNIDVNKGGFYWTRNLSGSDDLYAICLQISDNGSKNKSAEIRYKGLNVRPVVCSHVADTIAKANGAAMLKEIVGGNSAAETDEAKNFPFTSCTYYLSHSFNNTNIENLFNTFIERYPYLRYTTALHDVAMSGNVNALFMLGYCYYRGLGTDINQSLSRECFMKAAEMGDSRSSVIMFVLGFADKYDRKCMGLLEKAVQAGFSPAIVLKTIFDTNLTESTIGMEQKAIIKKNLKPSVEQGYAEAEYLYGEYCDSIDYIEKAALHHYPYAAKRAIQLFAKQKDYNRAIRLVTLFKDNPECDVARHLLLEIQLNCDVPEELVRGLKTAYEAKNYDAVKYGYSRAKEKNISLPDMEVIMALCIRAEGDTNSCSMANKTLTEYAEQGNILAQEELAFSYEKGLGMSAPDMANAFTWYRKAAQNGSQKAQNYLKNRNMKW